LGNCKGSNSLSRPPRSEIQQYADDTFDLARERLLTQDAQEQAHVLRKVSREGNVGGYLPALIKCKTEHLRKMILAQADAYVVAFKLYGEPADARAETDLRKTALEMAAGTISAVRGQLDLRAKRTRRPLEDPGSHLGREIEAAMKSAVKEGVLRLRRQRIESDAPKRADSSASPNSLTAADLGGDRKPRGRPTEIADTLKERALRASGGQERARILYQTRYPTPQQIKNVPSILRHFKRTREKPE
jgi:hypothetical protein